MNASTSKRLRPGVPPGPYLVVGLARSGQAAARLLAARGEEVIGCDSGSPAGRKGFGRPASKFTWIRMESPCSNALAAWSRAPACPRGAGRRGGSGARDRGARRARAGLAGASEPLRRGDRDQRQDHRDRAARPRLAHRRPSRSRSPATSAPRSPRWSARSTPRRRSSARPRASSSRTPRPSRPECAVFLNLAPDHLDRHGDFEDYLQAKLRIFANQGNDDVAVFNARRARARRQRPRRLRPADRLLPRSRPRLRGLAHRGRDLRRRRAADGGRRAGAARPAQRRQRDGGRRRGAGDGDRPRRRRARGCGPSPASRTGSSGWPRSTASLYVNDSKATNVAAAVAALRSFDGGVRAILGGRSKGGGFEAAGRAGRRALRRLLPDRRGRRALASDAGAGRAAGVELRRCGDLEDAVARGRRATRSRARWSCSRPACASFDAFRDFEERGERFRALVEELER